MVCLYQKIVLWPKIGWHLIVTSCPISVTLCLGVWVTPASMSSVKRHRIWGQNKKHNWKNNWQYPKMQVLYLWGLTFSQETKDQTAEEPGGHGGGGGGGRWRLHLDETFVGMNTGAEDSRPFTQNKRGDCQWHHHLCPCSKELPPKVNATVDRVK